MPAIPIRQHGGQQPQDAGRELQKGDLVMIKGATSSDLNGSFAECEKFDETSGKWRVRLRRTGDAKKLRPECLVLQKGGARVAPVRSSSSRMEVAPKQAPDEADNEEAVAPTEGLRVVNKFGKRGQVLQVVDRQKFQVRFDDGEVATRPIANFKTEDGQRVGFAGTQAVRTRSESYSQSKGQGTGSHPHSVRAASANPNQAEELPALIETPEEEQPARAPAERLPGSRRQAEVPNVLEIGKGVRLKGLVSAAQWNGEAGTLEEWDSVNGRWLVRMRSGDEIKKLKPENMEPEAAITLRIRDEKGAFGGGFFYVTVGDTWNVSRVKQQIEEDTEILRGELGLLFDGRLVDDDELVEVLMTSGSQAVKRYTECMDLNIIRRPLLKSVEIESTTVERVDPFASPPSGSSLRVNPTQGYPAVGSVAVGAAHFSTISTNLMASSSGMPQLQKVGAQRRAPPVALRSPAATRSNLMTMAR